MLFERLYHRGLAQASYLIGCQTAGAALVVDPNRDIDQYLAAAARQPRRDGWEARSAGSARPVMKMKHLFRHSGHARTLKGRATAREGHRRGLMRKPA